MKVTFNKTKRRLFIQSETAAEAKEFKALGETMRRYDSAVNITYPDGQTELALTPVTATFVLAAKQMVEEQTRR